MSLETPDRTTATQKHTIKPVQRAPEGSWWSALGDRGQKAFKAAFAGYSLDAFDLIILTLTLAAIGTTFGVGKGATGALATVTLSASAVGGILGGVLSDRIGRARTLMLTVGVYSVFTFLSGLASSYEMLLVFRVFQGIGFGGEWAVGAILVAELIRPENRGQALGVIQSAWAVGWALAVVAYTIVFSLVSDEQGWRILMMLGILPALLILYVRRNVDDPEVFSETKKKEKRGREGGQPAEADLPRRPRQDDDLRLDPRHRHPGRLLRDVHLDPDLPQGGAQPVRGRQRGLPVRGHRRRVPRLPDRGLRPRPPRPPQELHAVRRRWPASRWWPTSWSRAAPTRRC